MKNNSPIISKLAQAHDSFFKTAMKDKRVAHEFFEAHLPKEISTLINFNQLKLTSESYIDDLRKTSIADLLFKTEIENYPTYLYLVVDHQSKPDKLMPLRMLKYTCNIIDQHLKENHSKNIPLVLPLVLYHGKKP